MCYSSWQVKYDWESEGVIVDLDGTLTGSKKANRKIVPCTPSLDSNECLENVISTVNVAPCVCSDQIKLIRWVLTWSLIEFHMVQNEYNTHGMVVNSNRPSCYKRIFCIALFFWLFKRPQQPIYLKAKRCGVNVHLFTFLYRCSSCSWKAWKVLWHNCYVLFAFQVLLQQYSTRVPTRPRCHVHHGVRNQL